MITNECIIPVNKAKGEYVRRLHKDGTPHSKTYKVIAFDRAEQKWQLDDVEDIGRCIYLRSSVKVFAGFTY